MEFLAVIKVKVNNIAQVVKSNNKKNIIKHNNR